MEETALPVDSPHPAAEQLSDVGENHADVSDDSEPKQFRLCRAQSRCRCLHKAPTLTAFCSVAMNTFKLLWALFEFPKLMFYETLLLFWFGTRTRSRGNAKPRSLPLCRALLERRSSSEEIWRLGACSTSAIVPFVLRVSFRPCVIECFAMHVLHEAAGFRG